MGAARQNQILNNGCKSDLYIKQEELVLEVSETVLERQPSWRHEKYDATPYHTHSTTTITWFENMKDIKVRSFSENWEQSFRRYNLTAKSKYAQKQS